MLSIAEGDAEIPVGGLQQNVTSPDCRRGMCAGSDARRGFGQNDDAGIYLWQPENRGIRRWGTGIDREIASPTAAEFVRSVGRGLHRQRLRLQNLRNRHRCDGAIPRRGRMLSTYPDGHIPPKNARSMRHGSSCPPESFPRDWEYSGFPRGLSYGRRLKVYR